MRYVVAWMIVSLWSTSGAVPKPEANTKSLTLLFGFDGPYSEKSLAEMKLELATILKDSGLRVDWRERSGLQPEETFQNLVVVKFRGKCRMEPLPYLYDERGPLAFTYDS